MNRKEFLIKTMTSGLFLSGMPVFDLFALGNNGRNKNLLDSASFQYEVKDKSNVFLAVLAYEYRPAYKVPPFGKRNRNGKEIAQLVFSRCGISRIGAHDPNYDSRNRSFTNLPNEKDQEGNIAVMPARYGLFLVELVDSNKMKVQLMNTTNKEKTRHRYFINPIKKISSNAVIEIKFGEYHLNEKLKRLAEYTYEDKKIELNGKFNLNKPPFIRINSSYDNGEKTDLHNSDLELVRLEKTGSSVLLNSIPRNLIRKAYQNSKLVSFKVHEKWKKKGHYNRRYGAIKMPNEDGNEITNVIIADILGRRKRRTTAFKSPKVAPLFANIKFENIEGNITHIDGENYKKELFEDKICKGGYDAVLFEDNICDGCISAEIIIHENKSAAQDWTSIKVLPAFSLVTAPDFFPYIDSNDIRNSYLRKDPNLNMDQDFFEGGTMNLSGIRQRGNPLLIDPFTKENAFKDSWTEDKSFDTLTSVISSIKEESSDRSSNSDYLFNFNKDYKQTSYLPDTGTGIFFPGWDVTYSGKEKNPYLSTFGLGSPFPEDMKLCAAANGMWPVTSPDAGRTFQGSLEPIFGKKPNTAIPLMDTEIGLHKNSPHVLYNDLKESFGWDGEQGPFLQVINDKIHINYTDIERADYLQNLLNPKIGFNISKLRDLESRELIYRMDSQRICIKHIDNKKVWVTQLWLVAAEKVSDWANVNSISCLPNNDLFIHIEASTRKTDDLMGDGYLYVFVKTKKNKGSEKGILDKSDPTQKRRILECDKICVCQVTRDALAYVQVNSRKNKKANWQTKTFK